MGLSFRRSVKLGRSTRVNFSGRGVSLSEKLAPGVSWNSRSGFRFSIPGSGLSYKPTKRRRRAAPDVF